MDAEGTETVVVRSMTRTACSTLTVASGWVADRKSAVHAGRAVVIEQMPESLTVGCGKKLGESPIGSLWRQPSVQVFLLEVRPVVAIVAVSSSENRGATRPRASKRASGVCWTRLDGRSKQKTYLMMNNYLVHYWCYKGWGAPNNKVPLAVVAAVVLGSAGCRATGEVVVLVGWRGVVKDSAPVQGFVLGLTGEESRGAAGGDVVGDGCGGLLPGGDGAPDGGLAEASPAMGGGDAKRTPKSATLQRLW
jgi:hypothetical protein